MTRSQLWVPLIVGLLLATGSGTAAAAVGTPWRDNGWGPWITHVCSLPIPGVAGCNAEVVTNAGGRPLASSAPPAAAYSPGQFHSGYNLPTSAPNSETIGIVDAYDDPNIASDLATFDSYYGLPACTTSNGCFTKVNQSGGTSYPSSDAGWALEISLDVEMAQSICQNCKIVLVEASSASLASLGAAENEAVALGANVISNSWGSSEYSSETSDESSYFHHTGVAITASAGDSGYGVEFPAASQYVTAVGGTTLNLNSNGGYGSESVWSGTGSGCSQYEPKPSWQHDTGCSKRVVNDVAADADPNTGAAVYDSVRYSGQAGWFQVGGTSLASPLIAAVYALAGTPTSDVYGSTPYANPSLLHDVTSGSNGSCGGGYLCTAGNGYDGPSGLGTPNGVGAFSGAPTTVSGAPTGLTAKAGNGSVTLSWTAPSNSGGSPITGYDVYRGTSTGGEAATPVATVTGTSYTGSGLANGTTYYYEVSAVNGVGISPPSNEAFAAPAATAAGAPTGLTAAPGNGSVGLSWTAPSNNGGSAVTGYDVYRGTSTGGEAATPVATVTGTSYTSSGLSNGTTYYYEVSAINGVGIGPRSNEAFAVPAIAPGAPTGLTAAPGNGSVALSWTAPSNNGGSAVTGYDVYRGTSTGGEAATPVATVTGTTYTDSGLSDGTTYYYEVSAVNAVGIGPQSNEAFAAPAAAVAGAPTGLAAAPGNGSVALSWTAPSNNGGSAVTAYDVYRGTATGGEAATPVATVSGTSYVDSGLSNGTTYYYEVSAVNGVGVGPQSNEASAAPQAPVAGDFSISISPSSRTLGSSGSTTYLVTITPSNGFSGSVSLSVSGLQAGVTASFSPNPTTSSSTMTVTSSRAGFSRVTFTVTGVSGSLSNSATASLFVF